MANVRIPLTLTTTPRTAVDTTHDSLVQNMMNEQSKTGAKFARKRPSLSLHVEASTNSSHVAGIFYDAPRDRFVYVDEGFRLRAVRRTPIAMWSPVVKYPPGSKLEMPQVETPEETVGKPPSSGPWVPKVRRRILQGTLETGYPTPSISPTYVGFFGYSSSDDVFEYSQTVIPANSGAIQCNTDPFLNPITAVSSTLSVTSHYISEGSELLGFSHRDSSITIVGPTSNILDVSQNYIHFNIYDGLWEAELRTSNRTNVLVSELPVGSLVEVYKNGSIIEIVVNETIIHTYNAPPSSWFTYKKDKAYYLEYVPIPDALLCQPSSPYPQYEYSDTLATLESREPLLSYTDYL